MKTEVKKEIAISLTLTEKEAEWLKCFVQNSHSEREDENQARYRHDLFNALKTALSN